MTTLRLSLHSDAHWPLPRARAWRIVCESGLLWVSAQGDAQDYILWPGQVLELYAKRAVLVGALAESICRLEAPLPAGRFKALLAAPRPAY